MPQDMKVTMYRLNNVDLSPAISRSIPVPLSLVEYSVDDRIPYIKSLVRYPDPNSPQGVGVAYVAEAVADILAAGAPGQLGNSSFANALVFDTDKDIYFNATGQSLVFTLGSPNVNGVTLFLRLNKPNAVSFPANFEAMASSVAIDPTKMNAIMLIYYSNWDGNGTPHVIYSNSLLTNL